MNSLTFFYLKMFWFLLYFLKNGLLNVEFLADKTFFQHIEYVIATEFLLPGFLMRNQLLILLRRLCTEWVILSWFFLILSFCLSSILLWCDYVWICFILLFVELLKCVDGFVTKFRMLWHYFFIYPFCSFLSSSSVIPIMHLLAHFMVFLRFLRFCISFSSFSFSS